MLRIVLAGLATLALISCGGGGGDAAPAAGSTSTAAAISSAPITVDVMSQLRSSAPGQAHKAPALLAGEVARVNATTAGDQTLRTVGATSDGGYVVAWLSGGSALFIRAFDSSGVAAGPETSVPVDIVAPTPAAAAQAIEQSSLAVLSDGSVVVLYRVTRNVDVAGGFVQTTTGVYFQRFDSNGVLLTPETQVAAQAFAGPKGPFIAQSAARALSDGGFVTAWTVAHYSTRFGAILTLSLRWFDGQGNAVGSPTEVGDFPELAFGVVADLHGGLTLSTVRTDNFYRRESDVFHYDAGHVFVEVVPPTLRQVLLLPLEQGYVLFASDGSGATQQLLDAPGAPVGTPAAIPSIPLAARELADGTYVTLQPAGNGAFTIQWFAADMTPLDAQLAIFSRGVLPQLASLADPGFAAAWTGASANEGLDVYTQAFDVGAGTRKKACLDSAKQQRLTGQARKAFMEACVA
jgi:hypothetical protein